MRNQNLIFLTKNKCIFFKTLIISMIIEINLRNRCVTRTLSLARIKAIIFKELLDEIGFFGKRGMFTLGDFGDLVR